jgi:hypothetical protein
VLSSQRGGGGGGGFVSEHLPESGGEVMDLFVAREEVHINDEELISGTGGGGGAPAALVRDQHIEPEESEAEAFLQMRGDLFESL